MSYENVLKYREQVYRCNTCCRCPRGPWDPNQPDILPLPVKQCPIYEQHVSLASSSQGMILMIRDLLEDKLEASDALVEHIYQCLLCEGCNAVCAGMDSIPLGSLECASIFRALRADFVDMGIAPPAGLKKFTDNIAEKHSRQGVVKKDRIAWTDDLGFEVKDGGEVVIFAGCTAAFADNSSVLALAKILQKAGVDFGVLADEWCCGCLQEDAGILDGFKLSAEHNVEAIKNAGAKTVVVTCADCYKALNDYPAFVGELGFEVLHSSELILRLVKEGKIALDTVELGGVATYNDPCFLARGNGKAVTSEPREVLQAIPGTEWVEMEGFGKYTYCCGRPITAPASRETYEKTGLDRVGDALAVEAKTIVTGCANCKT
ncbi:MAG: (Fe-S)-binding protein, partial [Coriobacteriia bacterium]|nr:(Fe-S)-binding protein [Coriobacteriia bacterium]